jgi:biotin synthase
MADASALPPEIRHEWSVAEVEALFALPFNDLVFRAQTVHRTHFPANQVQLSTLLSIKTGGCPEDCAYCPQAARYDTGVEAQKLMAVQTVLAEAKRAKESGASRYCMGAAWREPKDRDLDAICDMVQGVKALGMETCMTLGMLTAAQAQRLSDAGLDYYNHNLDTSPEHYKKIISTRTYQERLDTLENVRNANINVCCGGIMGLGETRDDRINFLLQLANLPEHPLSVPINKLIPIPGTPLANHPALDSFEFIRTIAIARITMPHSMVRLSAGRDQMNEEMQALCFFAGANSIHYGEQLLTTPNVEPEQDQALLKKLGIKPSLTNTALA